MTQPEETTAALIARLHNELEAARKGIERLIDERDYHKKVQAEAQDGHEHALNMHRAAARERDEQRARADAAERARESSTEAARRRGERLNNISNLCTAAGWAEKLGEDELQQVNRCIRELKEQASGQQKRADNLARALEELRARTEKAEDELAKERQRASDQRARAETLAQRVEERTRERDEILANAKQIEKELADTREQFGRVQADYQVFMLGTAHGAKCWADECGWHCGDGCKAKHARKCVAAHELKDAREQLAKLEWAGAHGAGCLLCGQMRQAGHRPTCWFAKKDKQVTIPAGMLKVGDMVTFHCIYRPDGAPAYAIGSKTETVDTTRDAMLSVTATKSEPARPEPRFKVGEWVTSGGQEVGEIQGRLWKDGVWHYSVLGFTAREEWLTAQTPQHKHDCTGSVFLGRHERFDLWWRPTMREVVAVEPTVAHCYSVDGELVSTNPLAIEARRRAVAKGLVK